MKKLLKLQEHKHTAKKLAHHHTSYRALWLIMVIFGICLFAIQRAVTAESYMVTASVPAPIPSTPAVINDPKDKAVVQTSNIIVSGNCPIIVPAIIVGIYSNDTLVGSSGCSASGQFSAVVHLVPGQNILIPRIYTITNDGGPIGSPISITLVLSASTSTVRSTSNSSISNSTSPSSNIFLSADKPFILYKSGQKLIWPIKIEGGTPPYVLSIDWGDNTKIAINSKTYGVVELSHSYTGSDTYLIRLTVRDSTGSVASISVVAVSLALGKTPSVYGATLNTDSTGSIIDFNGPVIAYMLVIIGLIAFWFGSRYQHKLLVADKKLKK
jgi:hypothetical protein